MEFGAIQCVNTTESQWCLMVGRKPDGCVATA